MEDGPSWTMADYQARTASFGSFLLRRFRGTTFLHFALVEQLLHDIRGDGTMVFFLQGLKATCGRTNSAINAPFMTGKPGFPWRKATQVSLDKDCGEGITRRYLPKVWSNSVIVQLKGFWINIGWMWLRTESGLKCKALILIIDDTIPWLRVTRKFIHCHWKRFITSDMKMHIWKQLHHQSTHTGGWHWPGVLTNHLQRPLEQERHLWPVSTFVCLSGWNCKIPRDRFRSCSPPVDYGWKNRTKYEVGKSREKTMTKNCHEYR